jgi:hypothetical protein
VINFSSFSQKFPEKRMFFFEKNNKKVDKTSEKWIRKVDKTSEK